LPAGFSAKKTFELPARHIIRTLPPVSILRKLLAIGLVLLMQGPAMMVQEVAWVKMLVSYTRESGLKQGVIATFDGKHPCSLCKQAAEFRKQEQPQDPAEKQMPAQRQRLAWAEMVASDLLKMPVITGHDVSARMTACTARDSGKGADAPDSPPPEWG
jgi:hypothetical protein